MEDDNNDALWYLAVGSATVLAIGTVTTWTRATRYSKNHSPDFDDFVEASSHSAKFLGFVSWPIVGSISLISGWLNGSVCRKCGEEHDRKRK